MPQATTLQVTLSKEAFEFVQKKVASGKFASPSEVLSEGVESLRDHANDQAHWEREVLLPSLERMESEPDSFIPLDQVVENLEARRRQRRLAR